jgi:hypothetical protein
MFAGKANHTPGGELLGRSLALDYARNKCSSLSDFFMSSKETILSSDKETLFREPLLKGKTQYG